MVTAKAIQKIAKNIPARLLQLENFITRTIEAFVIKIQKHV